MGRRARLAMTPSRSRARRQPRPSRLRVVVTAGPTREYIDPVRYLSNESSGRMGFAIAAEAARAGHKVTLIAGPVTLATPPGVERVDVVSAREMLTATRAAMREANALFMAAAVADFRPRRQLTGKWRAKDSKAGSASLELVQNPDILADVTSRRDRKTRLVVGFALETSDGVRRARAKLERKGADYVVLNDASALNSASTSVIILGSDGSRRHMTDRTKEDVARALVRLLARPPA
jgi:phosphopantothenoylcysteine decarboxylase/phosphopantothenate--cysteine ligase